MKIELIKGDITKRNVDAIVNAANTSLLGGGEVDGVGREIYKDPVTDDGTKKSAKGLIKIVKENGTFKLIDQVSWDEEKTSELKEVFKDGKLMVDWSLAEIRQNLKSEILENA